MQKLIELCLSTELLYFDNHVLIRENSGLTGLALMVVILVVFRQLLKSVATNLALLTYKRSVDDSHRRFETVHQSHSFLDIYLNKTKQHNTHCYNYKHRRGEI